MCGLYIYIYIYIYIYTSTLYGEGDQAARDIFANWQFQVLPAPSITSWQSSFQSFPGLHSATASFPIWYLLLAVGTSAIWCLVTVCWTRGRTSCHLMGVYSQPGPPRGTHEKSSDFKPASKTPKTRNKKWQQIHQKTPTWDPKSFLRMPRVRLLGTFFEESPADVVKLLGEVTFAKFWRSRLKHHLNYLAL